MRPDPRLLVPCDVLPFVPEGARVWVGDAPLTVNRHGDGVRGSDMLDLSAPALRDGLPERLDALPWAPDLLGWEAAIWVSSWPTYIETDNRGSVAKVPDGLDLSGLTSDEAARAVVVAALVVRPEVKP